MKRKSPLNMLRKSVCMLAILSLAACAQQGAIPAAEHFGTAMDRADKALRPQIAQTAAADLDHARQAALASGMRLVEPSEACNAYFTARPGVHFSACPAQLDIENFTPVQTPAMVALVMLDVQSAFGAVIKTLATSTAPKDTAAALETFVQNSKDLAKQLDAVQVQKVAAQFQDQMGTIKLVATALVSAQQASSICTQMMRAKAAFYGANQVLRTYADVFIDPVPTQHHQAYEAAKQHPGEQKRAAAEYVAWRQSDAKSPAAALDAASVEFDATLAACGH